MANLPSQPLRLNTECRDGIVIVTIAGSADMDDIPALRECLCQAASDAGDLLVLDLSGLTFICSEGLGAFLKARKLAAGVIRVVRPPAMVLKVLETTRLTKVMPVFDTLDAAVTG